MKRSEMILILRTVLKLNHAEDAYAFQRGEISLGALADRVIPSILDRAEREGMLPPARDELVGPSEIVESGYKPTWLLLRNWDKE